MEELAIVIVTYRRQELLSKLLESLLFLKSAPWKVYVIDNENSPETAKLVEIYARLVDEGLTQTPWPSGKESFVYAPQLENTGGAGGFSEGVRLAYEAGASWFWLMDDDVRVFPDSIDNLGKWTDTFDAIQGSRLDFDGGPFFWQYHFIERLGMYDPLAKSTFDPSGFKPMNALCFEGGLFNRTVVDRIGLPDARFFIYWDDCIYGYLASKVARTALVSDVILQRTRDLKNWEVTGVRQLNSSSDMTRYHVMRNRGHMAHYLDLWGDYDRAGFALGTVLCFAKELVRLVVVEKSQIRSGIASLVRGWRDGRTILHDDQWQPYGKGEHVSETI